MAPAIGCADLTLLSMSISTQAWLWFQGVIEDLPPEVVDQLPDDVVQQLRDGVIDKIPEDVVDGLPESVQDRIPEGLVDFASSNTGLAIGLGVIGVLAVLGFIWGVQKAANKAVVFFGVVGAVAWFLFFQQ